MKFLMFLFFAIFVNIGSVSCDTVNIEWMDGDYLYDTSSCDVGDDLILPTTPTKHGYTFLGWAYGVINGNCTQSGTPTPTNPIEPSCVYLGNTVLRAVGNGDNAIMDGYDPETRTIIRRIGVKVLDGTEVWTIDGVSATYGTNFKTEINDAKLWTLNSTEGTCNQFNAVSDSVGKGSIPTWCFRGSSASKAYWFRSNLHTTTAEWQQYLASQYASGTPVTIYYPLATPVEEHLWSISQQ